MTVMRDAMTKDIVHGNYSPQNQPVDFCSALQHAIRSNRFEFSWGPDPFPVILTDVCVMLYIAKNAASNACKYGGPGPIKMEVSLLDNELRLMCKNPPGEGHEELMKLENPAVVFEKESRLHGSILPEVPGAGHGGWIVQLCAQALKGTCTIEFTPSETIFELRCPAKVHVTQEMITEFACPSSVFVVVLDDSRSQRHLFQLNLKRYLAVLPENVIVMGESVEEAQGFVESMYNHIVSHPNAKYIIFFDENLDYTTVEGSVNISGSELGAELREKLSDKDERRILALARSANDSVQDVELYEKRLHGAFPKSNMNRTQLLENLVPRLVDRFGPSVCHQNDITDLSDSDMKAMVEIYLQEVAGLSFEQCTTAAQWADTWPVLHRLKGSAMVFQDDASEGLVEHIATMRGAKSPSADSFATLMAKFDLQKKSLGSTWGISM